MTINNSANQIVFCVHLKYKANTFQKALFKSGLKQQENISFVIQKNDECLGTYCLYLYTLVFFKKSFINDLVGVFASNKIKFAYSDYQVFSLFNRKIWREKLLPIWSPKRFWQLNYLGPVIAVNSQALELKKDLQYHELVVLILQKNAQKLNGIGFKVFSKVNEPTIYSHFTAVSSYLSKYFSELSIQLKTDTSIQISFKALAPKLVSVVVPTRGTLSPKSNIPLVCNLASSLNNQVFGNSKIELVVVYDDDVDRNYLNRLASACPNLEIKLIPFTPPFNFSSKSNLGAANAAGEIVIFINDDTKFISSDAVLELAGAAMLDDVGAVGAKLFFENGAIQHAGTVVIGGNLGHAYFKQMNPIGVFGDLTTIHEVSAITGACLAQRKKIWEELQGWDETFDNSYNDVDYCFRIREAGYSILQNNQVELYHFESLTRDATFSPKAKELIQNRWEKYIEDDKFFSQYVESQNQKLKFRVIIKKILKKVRSY